MGKRKEIVPGSCYKLSCIMGNQVFFAKQMANGITSFYHLPNLSESLLPDLSRENPIYSNYILVDVARGWTFLGVQKITESESLRVPKIF